MTTPMTPAQMLKAYKAEGLTVKEYEGWERRCRCCPDSGPHQLSGPYIRGWGDVNGQLAHITGGGLGKRTVEQYIRDIILYDPALLTKCHTVVDPAGVVWLVAAGRANHAGKVGKNVRAHMLAADYSLTDDYDSRFRGGVADGNAFTYGDECIAASKMNAKQYESLVRVHAARARFHDWTGQESVGHGEVSSARTPADPNLDMGKFRRDVMARVKAGPGSTPAPEPPPVPATKPALEVAAATLTTFNLAAKAHKWQRDTWTARLPEIAKVLNATGSDILCLQEVGSMSYVKQIDKVLPGFKRAPGAGWPLYNRWRYIYVNPKTYLVLKSGLMTLNTIGSKHAAWALVQHITTGKTLFVTSAHLTAGSTSTDSKRLSEAHVLVTKTRKLNNLDAPVIHAGDFNSAGLVGSQVIIPAGFKDTIATADKATGKTLNSNPGWDISARRQYPNQKKGWHLDHIYAAVGIDTKTWTLTSVPKASDHDPITARFTY